MIQGCLWINWGISWIFYISILQGVSLGCVPGVLGGTSSPSSGLYFYASSSLSVLG